MMTHIKKILFSNEYPSTAGHRREILKTLFSVIERSHVGTELTRDELTLVYDEAITNAMEHGNKWQTEKKVRVALWIEGSTLRLAIDDQGDGFDFTGMRTEFTDGNKLSRRGRGISLIKRFCSPLWSNGGRHIELPVRIKG
ncbi:MAG TPA: ATP-binding protein [Spirochaetota bacterium]|nr:ATP-binding protein [Spirochaetota bacterium]